jgi:hypothetical protein
MSLRIISEQELKTILDKHGKWLRRFGRGWKISKTLDGLYFVSKCGKVASILYPVGTIRERPLIIKQRQSINGYLCISLYGKNKLTHRVLANDFLGKVTKKVVHHKDGNRKNNCVENLEITNYSKNNKHGAIKRNSNKESIHKQLKSLSDKFNRGLFNQPSAESEE